MSARSSIARVAPVAHLGSLGSLGFLGSLAVFASLARAITCLASVVSTVIAPSAGAVILATGDGARNTDAPADDFGFAHVGTARETAVYIGNGWVITANHVQEGPVALGGRVYPPVVGSKQRLPNFEGGVSSDVALFRLQEPLPPLPALPIRLRPPSVGDRVVLMGNGANRGEPVELGGHRGWRWGEGTALRWGTNRIHELSRPVQAGRGDRTVSFSTRLSPVEPTEHESAVALGDSGGGAFIHNGERWELAGVLFATGAGDGQPPRTTLFGNITFIADLSHYGPQVLAIAGVPACRDGLDDDGDGLVDFPDDPGCAHADARREGATDVAEGPALSEAAALSDAAALSVAAALEEPDAATTPAPGTGCGSGFALGLLALPIVWRPHRRATRQA